MQFCDLCVRKIHLSAKRTVDLITDVTIPSSAGFTSYKDNMGETRNRGYEISLNAMIVNHKDFGVNVFANFAHNEGKLMKISESLKAYNERVMEFYREELKNQDLYKNALAFLLRQNAGFALFLERNKMLEK